MRKQPRQGRSREMVERILVAAREVLVDQGFDRFSTNRVAQAAGVSPGSLYQYFPDKASILDVLVDRYWDATSDRVVKALGDRLSGGTAAQRAASVVDALLQALEADPAMLRVVHDELPMSALRSRREALERRVQELTVAALAIEAAGWSAPADGRPAWLVVIGVESLAVRWVLDQPAGLGRDRFTRELTSLVLGYLETRGQG